MARSLDVLLHPVGFHTQPCRCLRQSEPFFLVHILTGWLLGGLPGHVLQKVERGESGLWALFIAHGELWHTLPQTAHSPEAPFHP